MRLVKVSDLFEVRYGVNLELMNLDVAEGGTEETVNFVSRTEYNNGVSAIVRKIGGISPLPPGTLTVAGGGSVLATFLQPYPYYSGRDLYYLIPKKKMTEQALIYYALCIRKNKYRYSYGRQANRTLASLKVPAVMPGKFLHTRISIPTSRAARKIHARLSQRKWKWFRYDQVFDIKKGRRLTKEDMEPGDTAFIGSSEMSNGMTARISQKPIHEGNTISVSYNGSVGEAFYQPRSYWASDDINVLYPKFKLNAHIGLFLATLIRKEKYRFSYGRKWHLERMKESKIKLPVNAKGVPDWVFMENYVKSLPYSASIS